jgi:hypothetical protein
MSGLPADDPWLVARVIDCRSSEAIDDEVARWAVAHLNSYRKYRDKDYTLYHLGLLSSLSRARRLELSDLLDARAVARREMYAA